MITAAIKSIASLCRSTSVTAAPSTTHILTDRMSGSQVMEELERLIEILEVSAKKNGKDTVLTIGHLLNICKKASRELEQEEFFGDMHR